MDLSIVVIARNEEKTIGKALEYVFLAIEEAKRAKVIQTAEVIFVDSASTDNTVEIAKGYPVKILELVKDWPLSAAAGIYSGYKTATGTFFGVVDGDVYVDKNWFRDALPYLQKDNTVGALYGSCEEGSKAKGYIFRNILHELSTLKVTQVKEVDYVGNGIFSRNALEQIGGHNPYLKGSEDMDISFRLRGAGFNLLQIPVLFGTHNWHFSLKEYYRSVKGWSTGQGHAAAYAIATGNREVYEWFLERYPGNTLFRILRHGALTLLLGISFLCSLFWGGFWRWISLVLGIIFTIQLLRAKSKDPLPWNEFLFHYFHRIPYFLYRFWYFRKGLKLPTPDPKTYPQSKINK